MYSISVQRFSSSVTFEVSTTPVAKLTRDSISRTKGLLNKPDKDKTVNQLPDVFLISLHSLRRSFLVLLRGRFLSELHIFFRAMRLFGEQLETIFLAILDFEICQHSHPLTSIRLRGLLQGCVSRETRKCLITAANGAIFSNKFLIHF